MSDPDSRRIALATGLSLHVLEWGARDPALDHTVVLLHGFLDLAWGWVPVVKEGLAGRFHVVVPEMRGHGDSDRVGPGGFYHFADYTADLGALLRGLGRRRLSLVGHSMGGTIASMYAGTYPESVEKLVLLEGTGPAEGTPTGPGRMRTFLESWQRVAGGASRGHATVAAAAERLRARDALLPADLALWLAERGTRQHADGRWRFKHDPLHLCVGPYAFQVETAQRFWRNIRSPVLIVEGGRSEMRLTPEDRARRHASFANRREVVLEEAGHMMHRHQPGKLGALLAEFLSD